MTPKEKALQLCQKFGYLGIKWEQTEYTTLSLENAKECALIAVDEILETLKISLGKDKSSEDVVDFASKRIIYWQEVKQEIQKL